jgi:hypothetical protein
MNTLASWAEHLARALLPRRWAHVQGVAARARSLAPVLGASSVLTFCDMTTGPDGELVPVDRRLAEIHHR